MLQKCIADISIPVFLHIPTNSVAIETSSNLRRDITAETSLMNDLDKRLNTDLDSSSSTLPDQFSKRNVNLLISLPSDDNLHANSHVPVFVGDTSKTNSENGSVNGRSCQFSDTSKFSFCLAVCLPACLSVCLPVCLSACLSVCPCVWRSV